MARTGAEFLTPPTDRGVELRCYMRDPDGHLIEVGQATPEGHAGRRLRQANIVDCLVQ
jgi:hypothetical protein